MELCSQRRRRLFLRARCVGVRCVVRCVCPPSFPVCACVTYTFTPDSEDFIFIPEYSGFQKGVATQIRNSKE